MANIRLNNKKEFEDRLKEFRKGNTLEVMTEKGMDQPDLYVRPGSTGTIIDMQITRTTREAINTVVVKYVGGIPQGITEYSSHKKLGGELSDLTVVESKEISQHPELFGRSNNYF